MKVLKMCEKLFRTCFWRSLKACHQSNICILFNFFLVSWRFVLSMSIHVLFNMWKKWRWIELCLLYLKNGLLLTVLLIVRQKTEPRCILMGDVEIHQRPWTCLVTNFGFKVPLDPTKASFQCVSPQIQAFWTTIMFHTKQNMSCL